ncbi:MAG: DUF4412 domain-containing protein [Chthoniobacterales bacterium]
MIRLSLAFALSISLTLTAWADITIVQKLETPDGDKLTGDITISAKKSKTRVDMGSEMSTISDDQSKKVITLVHGQKMALEMPPEAVAQMEAQINAANAEELAPDAFKPTGRKETINGFECAEYTFQIKGQEITSWFAESLKQNAEVAAAFEELSKSSNPMASSLAQFDAMPGIPIRTEVEIPGSGMTTVTVQKISTDTIPASVFEIPSGYRALQMPAIPKPN